MNEKKLDDDAVAAERESRFAWGSDDVRSLVINGKHIKSEPAPKPPAK